MREIWHKTAKDNGFEISISGLPALSNYTIQSEKFFLQNTYNSRIS